MLGAIFCVLAVVDMFSEKPSHNLIFAATLFFVGCFWVLDSIAFWIIKEKQP